MTVITKRLNNWCERTSSAPKFAAEIVAAAIIAAGMTVLTGGSRQPEASASTVVERLIGANASRSACGKRAWPYLAPSCLRRLDNKPIRPVRVIAMNGQAGR